MRTDYCVYKHTSPSGKVYIGITQQNPVRRWQNGYGYRLNGYFFKAIIKHGWDNFTHEIIRAEMTKEEACALERALISFYESTDPARGYNLSEGGEHSSPTESTRQKISAANKGRKPYNAGKHLSQEHRRKTSEALIGHKVSEASRVKMRANHAKKAVRCIETGLIYESTIEAERKTGIRHDGISKCCRNIPKHITAGGYHWEFTDGAQLRNEE